MDCSVTPVKKFPDLVVVTTTDFFYPLVEDPYLQGRIACANVLSDMYSMGVADVDTTLMLLAASSNIPEPHRTVVTRHMLRGFADLAREAEAEVTGGQTVVNPWPIVGGVAMATCRRADVIMPRHAVAGDVIVLTKPLGTQVAVNLREWMADEAKWQQRASALISKEEAVRAFLLAQKSMCRLNRTGARLMHKYKAHAATDVTGFGVLGHLNNLASNQEAAVSMVLHTLPCLRGMAAVDRALNMFKLLRGFSAETSGGLLICMPRDAAAGYCREIEQLDGEPAWIVGDVVAGDRTARIADDARVIDV
jgi:selenide,water dikinase